MGELVSKRYALALFEAAEELDKIDLFKDQLDFLMTVLNDQPDLMRMLNHPRIKKDEKKELIDKLFENRLSKEVINFLYILVDKRRESDVYGIIEKYEDLYNEYKNIVEVVAKTAVPMEDQAKDKLIQALEAKLEKTIHLTNEIDSLVIGGVLLEVENKVIDGTLKGQLDSISKLIIGTKTS